MTVDICIRFQGLFSTCITYSIFQPSVNQKASRLYTYS